MNPGTPRFESFRDFYPYYLGEHRNRICRRLHFAGTTLVIVIVIAVVSGAPAIWLTAIPLAGYGPAWAGHFFFEHNRPATFSYPVYSLAGDLRMFWQMLTGGLPF